MSEETDGSPGGTAGGADGPRSGGADGRAGAPEHGPGATGAVDGAVPGGAWYQVGAAVVAGGVGVAGLVGSWGLGVGRLTAPGPGLWPFAVSLLITGLAVVLGVSGRGAADTERFTRASRRVAGVVVGLVGFAVLLPLVGFEIPSVVLLLAWMRVLGKEAWGLSVVVSVGTVAAFYGVFVVLLEIPLPRLI
ncbi:tripartite tricarboxylate transporter TctB family protein [Kribbella sandramycini]|uniref:Tripartite tricarboxylate transporter TctB family protein n=1 Tax=Kribbella sandramycini TaxID=60450 RepID=A0A7Y4P3A7_9ACTN|nr:tripartite tricarboxylate transporter TctB family protein [Kribbella sandramycini]